MVAPLLFASLLIALPVQSPPDAQPAAWLGVSLSESGPDDGPGLEVVRVVEGSPAEAAGLRTGDRLMSIGDEEIRTYEQLIDRMRRERPGGRQQLWVRRTAEVRLEPERTEDGRPLLGVMLERGRSPGMVAIREVLPDTPAARAGLEGGDQIRILDGEPTGSPRRFQELMADRDPAGSVVVEYSRRLEVVFGRAPRPAPEGEARRRREREPRFELEPRPGDEPRVDRDRLHERLRDIDEARERMRREHDDAVRDEGRNHEFDGRRRDEHHDREFDDGRHDPRSDRSFEDRRRGERRDREFGERSPQDRGPGGPDFDRRMPPPSGDHAALERELRELAEELRGLRSEIAELRFELEALRNERR